MLQLDGYESYLNAISSVDVNGHINEVVSPGDCTYLCSTSDQEIGKSTSMWLLKNTFVNILIGGKKEKFQRQKEESFSPFALGMPLMRSCSEETSLDELLEEQE